MANVIDSFVVELGLDASKFTKEQRAAVDSAKKMQEELAKGGKGIEKSSTQALDSLSNLATKTLGFFGVAASAAGVGAFIKSTVQAGAQVGMLSRNIGVSSEEIQRFTGLAQASGGSAEGMAQSMKTLSDTFAAWKHGGSDPLIGVLNNLNSAAAQFDKANAVLIDPKTQTRNEYFMALAKNLKIVYDHEKDLAGLYQSQLGMDPGIYDRIIDGADKFAEALSKVKVQTKEEIEQARILNQEWGDLMTTLERGAKSVILGALKSDMQDINMVKGWFGFGKANASPASSAGGAFKSASEKEAFIRQTASAAGLDPNIALRVAKSEGFNQFSGDNGTSFGAFQLHITPGGRGKAVGDQFKSDTGLDPSDPANERATIMYALEFAKRHGWKDFHGAARVGIPNFAGIPQGGGNSVTIGSINVQTQPGADGKEIGTDISSEIRRRQASNANVAGGSQ